MNDRKLFVIGLCVTLPASNVEGVQGSNSKCEVLFFGLWKLDCWNNVELKQGESEFIPEASYNDPAEPLRGV